jgi:hypothetical protein
MQNSNIQEFRNLYDKDIVFINYKIGFPAFQISRIEYGYEIMTKNRKRLNILKSKNELIPDSIYLGNEDDEIRKILCLGKAFKIFIVREEGSYYKNEYIGGEDHEIIEILKDNKNINLKTNIAKDIEKNKNSKSSMNILNNYTENAKLSDIDKIIIDRVKEEIL